MASKNLEAGPAKRTMETQLSRALTDSELNRWGKILKIDEKTKIMSWKKKQYHLIQTQAGRYYPGQNRTTKEEERLALCRKMIMPSQTD